MKKVKVLIFALLTIVSFIVTLYGCSPESMESQLLGRWLWEDDMESGIEFYSDGDGIGFSGSDIDSLNWSISERSLKISNPYGDEVILFDIDRLSDHQMVLSYENQTKTLVKDETMPVGLASSLFSLSPQMIMVCIGIVAIVLLVIIIIILTARFRKRKRRQFVAPQPVSPQKDDTPVPSNPNQLDQTELLWEDNVDQTNSDSEAPAMTLVLTDLSDPSRKYGAPVRGIIPIGRDISVCRIVINYDPSVARHQCDVFLEDGKLMLRNRSHSNITQVDGQRVEDKCPLQSGSILKMGRVQMRVEIM